MNLFICDGYKEDEKHQVWTVLIHDYIFLTNKGRYIGITHIYMGDQLLNTTELVVKIVKKNKKKKEL
jgi:hypothetical protein